MCRVCNWEHALDLGNDVLDACDGLPASADTFADNLRTKLTEMLNWISDNQHVTTKMRNAIESWQTACDRLA